MLPDSLLTPRSVASATVRRQWREIVDNAGGAGLYQPSIIACPVLPVLMPFQPLLVSVGLV